MTTHTPKGSMCMACEKARSDCSKLPFASMKPFTKFGDTVIVVCASFKPADRKKP